MKLEKPLPWRGIAISLAILSLYLASHLHVASKALKSAFYYDCTIIPIDAKTNAQLKGTHLKGPGSSSSDLLRQRFLITAKLDCSMVVSGIAYQPRIIGVDADGYEMVEITITENSPSEIRVPLHAKPTP